MDDAVTISLELCPHEGGLFRNAPPLSFTAELSKGGERLLFQLLKVQANVVIVH